MLSLAAPMAWCYLLFFCRLVKYGEARENEGTEREAPDPALGICHVHESLCFSGSLFFETSACRPTSV